MNLQELVQDAWTPAELDLFSELLQFASSEGSVRIAHLVPILTMSEPQGLVCGRALLWSAAIGRTGSLHRELFKQQLRLAATQVGPLGLSWQTTTGCCERWETPGDAEPTLIRRRALALLAEAAARRVWMPALTLAYPWDSEAITCCASLSRAACSPLALELERQTERLRGKLPT